MALTRMAKLVPLNKYIIFSAVVKAAVAGAGFALAFLASIDIAIAQFAKEAWDSWQVDQLISRFALVGAVGGALWQGIKIALIR